MRKIFFFFNDILNLSKFIEKIYKWQYLTKFYNYKAKINLKWYNYFLIIDFKLIKYIFKLDYLNLGLTSFLFNNNIYYITNLKNFNKILKSKKKINKKFLYFFFNRRNESLTQILYFLYFLKKNGNFKSIK